MSKVILEFSISLDGFIAGPDISADHPMGRGGERLHEWMFSPDRDDLDRDMAREISAVVGAVILGRRTFDIGVGIWEDTPYPAPSFVLTHRPREPLAMKSAKFTFVTQGIEAALDQARQAAGDKYIVVMGADAAGQFLAAGLFSGGGRIALTAVRTIPSSSVTHLRFEVERPKRSL